MDDRSQIYNILKNHIPIQEVSKVLDEIMDVMPTPDISNIAWSGECDICNGKGEMPALPAEYNKSTLMSKCTDCNGIGTITRPATIEEVIEWTMKTLDTLKECIAITDNEIPTINGGTLRVKE